jgi:hypothetical protein
MDGLLANREKNRAIMRINQEAEVITPKKGATITRSFRQAPGMTDGGGHHQRTVFKN